MELLVLAALGLAAILIKTFAHRENTDVVDSRDACGLPQEKEAPLPPTATASPPATPKTSKPKPRAPARKWTDCTPTPSGARHELSPKGKRAMALVEKARREGGLTITGRVKVIDGDTLILQNTHIRLAGIDAPEVDHPYGEASMWALRKLCAKQTVSAEIKPEMSHDRAVAVCKLEDGTDLAETLVRKGLALDWRTYSGGRYRCYEPPDARKKLWKTALRQGRAAR